MLATLRRLREIGVLGLNGRNGRYMLPNNPRRLYPLVDDKLRTKKLALEAGIAVPPLYAHLESPHDVRNLPEILKDHSDFVIKPAHGAGGDGILVVTATTSKGYRLANGTLISHEELELHIQNALSGIMSLGGQPDTVLVEYRVKFDPVFKDISYQGVPDIRIIVYRGVPIMAMVRLPTRQSGGRANLHQGAIGVGVDLAMGRTLQGVWKNDIIDEHPDTGHPISGVMIPHWEQLLMLGASSLELTGLGYQGMDIVLDRERGPLMLELNARPGLAIQIANQTGLETRLKDVDQKQTGVMDPQVRVDFARQRFQVNM